MRHAGHAITASPASPHQPAEFIHITRQPPHPAPRSYRRLPSLMPLSNAALVASTLLTFSRGARGGDSLQQPLESAFDRAP